MWSVLLPGYFEDNTLVVGRRNGMMMRWLMGSDGDDRMEEEAGK